MSDSFCPYPGLRPFTEKESIFFKGRDMQIEQIIDQLQERKFAMVTGASGDGKSSIVYAGVIPNIRAGFFRAKYNNWRVASFKPERSPMANFVKTISSELSLPADVVEKELNYGFSSLVELYKSSKWYLDTSSKDYLALDDSSQKKAKRKAANLFILIDQFEEFFTNPENFKEGIPSTESQKVVNILLETSKIALKQDLPIYVICTMRSDYIGQCASFRGLPEYIGFSQFFVPRLERKEIQEAISEPAELNANSISDRLKELMVNELNQGYDQLPVLQHTLNKIWQIADNGNKKMDIIHFAMLGGMSSDYLNEEDKANFDKWFITIPEYQKSYFENPSLENILDSSANELYETAYDSYLTKTDNKPLVSKEESQNIIKKTFQCLTKIDENRAVRNRMSLKEIQNIINDDAINHKTIALLIGAFREQGNTLLSPYESDIDDNTFQNEDTVLDITHESLIRNWQLLKLWAVEENDNHNVFLDLEKQLNRWLINNKSKDFLLPVGTLSYFDEWHTKTQPNKFWLARYNQDDIDNAAKIDVANTQIDNVKEFIKESRKEVHRREKQKKKRRVILSFLALFIIGILSLLSIWAIKQRSTALAQSEIAEKEREKAVLAKDNLAIANKEALTAKELAEEKEKQARAAKDEAEIMGQKAVKEKQRAEINARAALAAKIQAEKSAKEAYEAKESAILSKEESEKERKRADAELKKANENFGYILLTRAKKCIREKDNNGAKLFALNALKFLEEKYQQEAFDILSDYPDFPILSIEKVDPISDIFIGKNQALLAYKSDNGIIIKDLFNEVIICQIPSIPSGILSVCLLDSTSLSILSDNKTILIYDFLNKRYKKTIKTEKKIIDHSYTTILDECFVLYSDSSSSLLRKEEPYDLKEKVYKMFFAPEEKRWGSVGIKNNGIFMHSPHIYYGNHKSKVLDASFNNSNEYLATCDSQGDVNVWRVYYNERYYKLSGELPINCVTFMGSKKNLAVAQNDGTISLINAKGINKSGTINKYTSQQLYGTMKPVKNVAYYYLKSILYSIDVDGTLYCWSIPDLVSDSLNINSHSTENKLISFINLFEEKVNSLKANISETSDLEEAIRFVENRYRRKLNGIDLYSY